MRCHGRVVLLAALLGTSFGCGPTDTVTIQGCGATFPAPLYKRWFLEFYQQHPNVRVNYQAIGSGAGIQQFEEGLVLFGASDEALKPERLKDIAEKLSKLDNYKVELIQVPLTAGSVAICYNLPGDPPLKLSRKAYIDMLLGEITYWDDPRIQSINPGVKLPNQQMTFIRRAEGSGTTFVFTNHLNAIDPRWTTRASAVRASANPWNGRVGIGGKGNFRRQRGPHPANARGGSWATSRHGYAELTKLPMAALENQSGNFVLPTAENAKETLSEAQFDAVLGATVPDPKGAHGLSDRQLYLDRVSEELSRSQARSSVA